MHNIRSYIIYILMLLALDAVFSCNKTNYVGKNPYAGARTPLRVKLNTTRVTPASGATGTTVTLTGKGFAQYKDSGLAVQFNGVNGQIIKAGDSILQVKVPQGASSGMITMTVERQVFPGPFFQVNGAIRVDTLFHSIPGVSGGIINCIQFVPGGKYLIGGSFTDYDNSGLAKGYHGIARINADGSIDRSFKIGEGVQGTVNTIAIQASGKYIIGGNFNHYDKESVPGAISNILRLNADGSLDSVVITNQTGVQLTVPALNAYFDGQVAKILQTTDSGKLIIIGSFKYFIRKDYSISSIDGLRDSVAVDSIKMEGIAALNEDGTFDSTYNFNPVMHSSFAGANGPIYTAVMQPDGKVIIGGDFTTYDNKPANGIARLNRNGSPDPSFNAGAGPVKPVLSVALLPAGKYLIGGLFSNVAGKESRKVAVLNNNGSLDNSFNVGTGPTAGPDGIVFNVAVLKNGEIFVSGSFDNFSKVKRNGTVILDPDGKISDKYNNLGAMQPTGSISQVLNVPNENATILVGFFTHYDLQPANGIVKLDY